jgi:hypothetical protein
VRGLQDCNYGQASAWMAAACVRGVRSCAHSFLLRSCPLRRQFAEFNTNDYNGSRSSMYPEGVPCKFFCSLACRDRVLAFVNGLGDEGQQWWFHGARTRPCARVDAAISILWHGIDPNYGGDDRDFGGGLGDWKSFYVSNNVMAAVFFAAYQGGKDLTVLVYACRLGVRCHVASVLPDDGRKLAGPVRRRSVKVAPAPARSQHGASCVCAVCACVTRPEFACVVTAAPTCAPRNHHEFFTSACVRRVCPPPFDARRLEVRESKEACLQAGM